MPSAIRRQAEGRGYRRECIGGLRVTDSGFGLLEVLVSSLPGHDSDNASMPTRSQPAEKFRRYRARLKARGLRQIQLWVPDTTNPHFQEKLKLQIKRIEDSKEDRESLTFIEQVADWSD